MKSCLKAMCLAFVLSTGIFAQNVDEQYSRNEFYGGYSNQQFDRTQGYETFHGFESAYVRNVHRFIGVKADFSAAFRNKDIAVVSQTTPSGTFILGGESRQSLYNFLGGVQVKDNATKSRFKPFAHALVGVAHTRSTTKNFTCAGEVCAQLDLRDTTLSDTGFGGAFGGGLDIKINDRVDFRVVQVDYNPIRAGDRWNNNVRFGIGIVFK